MSKVKAILWGAMLAAGMALAWQGHQNRMMRAELAARGVSGAATSAHDIETVETRIARLRYGKLAEWTALANALPSKYFARALEASAGNGSEASKQFQLIILRRWAQISPIGAITFADSYNSFRRFGGDEAVMEVLKVWGSEDPEAAIAWVVKNWPYDEDEAVEVIKLDKLAPARALGLVAQFHTLSAQVGMMNDLFSRWADSDPASALALAQGVKDPLLQHYAYQGAVTGWGAKDPAGALAWALQQPEGLFKAQTINGLVSNWAGSNGSAAMSWAQQVPDEATRKEAVQDVLSEWTENSPQTAADYLLGQPASDEGAAELRNVFHRWAMEDAAQAEQYLAQLPESDASARDAAMVGYADGLAKEQPEKAVAWAQGLPEGELQGAVYATIAKMWLSRDKPAATAWIEGANLPDAAKQELLNAGAAAK